MSEVQAQVEINASAQEVWSALVDSGRLSQWLPTSVHLDAFGRLGGAGDHPRYFHYDLYSTVQEQATRWEANRSYAYQVGNIGPIRSAVASFQLTPSAQGITLIQTVSVEMKFGPLGMAMDTLLFRPQFRKQMKASLAALKGYVEGRQSTEGDGEFAFSMAA